MDEIPILVGVDEGNKVKKMKGYEKEGMVVLVGLGHYLMGLFLPILDELPHHPFFVFSSSF